VLELDRVIKVLLHFQRFYQFAVAAAVVGHFALLMSFARLPLFEIHLASCHYPSQ